ncbi:ABC transporter permease [Saccharibacillus sacchari]|uniref:ABC transporter permease n=1 Tax=Saccharibacillus sacchari TaxID=456493 RepID=A0ACC6PJL8_9BACL
MGKVNDKKDSERLIFDMPEKAGFRSSAALVQTLGSRCTEGSRHIEASGRFEHSKRTDASDRSNFSHKPSVSASDSPGIGQGAFERVAMDSSRSKSNIPNSRTVSGTDKKRAPRPGSTGILHLNPSIVAGGVLLLLTLAAVALKPIIAGYGPQDVDILGRLAPPGGVHALGTDNLGRDILSRVLYGAQISLLIGFCTAIVSSLLGLVIGLYAAMYRRLDQILMRVMDAIYAFPAILLAIAIVAALGPSVANLIACLSFVFIPAVARIVRSAALVAKEQTYVEAAKALGASNTRVIWRHILPATVAALVVQATFVFAEAIIVEAALSFLGAGIPAPTPSLGNLLSEGKQFIYNSWWMTMFPGLALIVLVLAVNLLGDGLRDLLDPQERTSRTGGGRLFSLRRPGLRRKAKKEAREEHAG